jgi:hypothetical protein
MLTCFSEAAVEALSIVAAMMLQAYTGMHRCAGYDILGFCCVIQLGALVVATTSFALCR